MSPVLALGQMRAGLAFERRARLHMPRLRAQESSVQLGRRRPEAQKVEQSSGNGLG
jgi:hypothetical protein